MGDYKKNRRSTAKQNDVSIEFTTIQPNSDPKYKFARPDLIEHEEEDKRDQQQAVEIIDGSGHRPNVEQANNPRFVEIVDWKTDSTGTSTDRNTGLHAASITGYAEEPILPLHKACTPLRDIVHNLTFYVQMALDETPKQPSDGLTIDESAAVRLYTIEWKKPYRSLSSMLNHTLMKDDRELLRPYFKYLKLLLTALVKLPCVPPLSIWRGVTKNLSSQYLPGTTPVTRWAFSSCTTALSVLENNMYLGNTEDRTLFSVEAINGRTIRAHSHYQTEDEILLLPGTQMIVQSQFSPEASLHIIHLKQVVPEEMLLEPPFEGPCLYEIPPRSEKWKFKEIKKIIQLTSPLLSIMAEFKEIKEIKITIQLISALLSITSGFKEFKEINEIIQLISALLSITLEFKEFKEINEIIQLTSPLLSIMAEFKEIKEFKEVKEIKEIISLISLFLSVTVKINRSNEMKLNT